MSFLLTLLSLLYAITGNYHDIQDGKNSIYIEKDTKSVVQRFLN